MPINIEMPKLSDTMTEGTVVRWLKKEGEEIEIGDIIAEIETDKATMEVESIDEGTIANILIDEGSEGVKVNSIIAVLAEDGEDVSAIGSAEPVEAKAETVPTKAEEVAPAAPTPIAAPKPTPAAPPQKGSRVFATPLARRIAEQQGIDISTVSGSGPHGRIIKADVENYSGSAKSAGGQAASTSVASMSDKEVLGYYNAEAYEELPHDGMRKIIAERLLQSTTTIPSYNISMACELDALLALRKEINASAPLGENDKPTYKVSVNDFIIKAMALALKDVPMANASWTSTARILHKTSDVGVAVAVDDGLFTPIVRDAETKSLVTISTEIKDMAKRARDKKLAPHEYQGGSTAVSNLGMFGVSNFTSIINPPHASIVSIGAGMPQAVSKNGELVSATVMDATFAFDHRVIDGALGAQLAVAFKNYIEKPVTMLI